jgi:hypothetical protein
VTTSIQAAVSAPTSFRLSASKLKRYLQCPRSYFLRYVAQVPENVGGRFLEVGDAYDRHVQWYLSSGKRGVQSIDTKIVKMFDAACPRLPRPGEAEVQREYRFEHADGFVVEGKPDIRRPCRVGDTKTTADKGPGLGRDKDKPPIALTAETLHHEPQPLLYAWCEFQLDPAAPECVLEWVYVSKQSKPTAWVARTTVARAEVVEWFDRVARPAAAAMAKLHAEVDADKVRAQLDACDEPKCWVRAQCSPFNGPNSYDGVDSGLSLVQLKGRRPVSPAVEGEGKFMAFDLKKLSEESVDLETPLRASVAPAINPPSEDHAPAIDRLRAAMADCQSAYERAERLLAELGGGS